MTLQQLEYIVALDDCRHYVKASEKCFVSQPNLTMQVKKFEEEIGVRIFNREKKPLQPTKLGEEIILRARQILRETKQIREFISVEKGSLEGEVRIGIIPTIAPYLLPLFLPKFIKENPKIHLKIEELQTDQIINKLDSGLIDIGLLVTPLNENSLREIPLYYEPFMLYLPDNYHLLKNKKIDVSDLDVSEMLVLNEGHCFRDQALAICSHRDKSESMSFDYQSGSIEALKGLVKNGVGYTLVPELSVIHDLRNKNLKRFVSPEPVREVSLITHENYVKNSLVNLIKDFIQGQVPQRLLSKKSIIGMKP